MPANQRSVRPRVGVPSTARAPGACVLFGGSSRTWFLPAVYLAVDLYTQVTVSRSTKTSLNSDPDAIRQHALFRHALAATQSDWVPLEVRSVSRVPRSAGLCSSAAFVVALTAALELQSGPLDLRWLAQTCFGIELAAQGHSTPGGTSASVAGGYISVNPGITSSGKLWTLDSDPGPWGVSRLEDPAWTWVLAYCGKRSERAESAQQRTRSTREWQGQAFEEALSSVAQRGAIAVAHAERDEVGRLLSLNCEILRAMGASNARVNALVDAAGPAATGVGITGTGGGTSLVALAKPNREVELIRILARAGAVPFAVKPSAGVESVELPESL